MSRKLIAFVLGLLLVVGGVATVVVMLFMVGMRVAPDQGVNCGSGMQPVAAYGDHGRTDLSPRQVANAAAIIAEGRQRGIPPRGILIALAVASQESGFRVYANDGLGDDLAPSQQGIETSLALPHGAVGTDHGSLGLFQQQWPWWGSMRELMDPRISAAKFYAALVKVEGWRQMTVTEAGQAVQNSAYPNAYADDVPLAEQLLDDPNLANASAATWSASGRYSCLPALGADGPVSFPLPRSAAVVDLRNWGDSGGRWARGHTGTDFSTPCGTPVLAATSGTVTVDPGQSWSGRWLVKISTGPGRLTTWYAHMGELTVHPGQIVSAGQQIGRVGQDGNASGCHLHFEVHPNGGSIYQDNINPTRWLADSGGTAQARWSPSTASAASGYVVATFNVLGASHTRATGTHPEMSPGRERVKGLIRLLERYRVDVIGLQEFQRPQHDEFLSRAGDRFAVWSPPGDTENSIAWRRSRFRFVGADTFAVPYFDGNLRQMPIVRLRDRSTGQDTLFVTVHNPANTSRFPRQERFRDQAVDRQVEVIRRLLDEYGLPVVVTGDLNSRREVFCELTAALPVAAASGGSNAGACMPPARMGIDWIYGSATLAFSDYTRDRSALVDQTSDHPFVVARARRIS